MVVKRHRCKRIDKGKDGGKEGHGEIKANI
jgi:hypothetical protein